MTKAGAVIYCRVSTKEQAENFSLATQEKACRNTSEREGLAVVAVYSEAETPSPWLALSFRRCRSIRPAPQGVGSGCGL